MSGEKDALKNWLDRRFADPLAAADLEHEGVILGRSPEEIEGGADDEDEDDLPAL